MQYNTWLPCVQVDYRNGTAMVKSHSTGNIFPVQLSPNIKYLVSKGDRLHVIKSHVSREWIAIDYQAMFSMTSGDEEEVNTYEY